MWTLILILFIINLIKQIFILEITKNATILCIIFITYILMTEVENKHLKEIIEIQDQTIDEAKEIIIKVVQRNDKLEKKKSTSYK